MSRVPISFYDIPGKLDGEKFLPLSQYRDIIFINNYFISNYGRVYTTYNGGRFLSPSTNHKGYYQVALTTTDGKLYSKTIHRLEMATFCPNFHMDDFQVNHADGNKKNNKLNNLEWCTQSENIRHAYRMGLMDMSFNRLLTDEDARIIREKYNAGSTIVDIWYEGYRDKISYDSVADICRNITYYDPNYIPRKGKTYLTKEEITNIRELYMGGLSKKIFGEIIIPIETTVIYVIFAITQ